MFATLVYLLPLNFGVFFIRLLNREATAGVYGLAYQGSYAYYLLAALAVQVVQPHISGTHGLEPSFIRKLAVFAGAFLGGLCVLTFMAGWLVIGVLLPPAYRAAVVPFFLLLGSALLLQIGSIASVFLLRVHEERFILVAYLVAAGVYATICPGLVLWADSVGAALGTVTACLVGTALCLGRAWLRVLPQT
jgi:O-antigen/teichoic acid export membrane protein